MSSQTIRRANKDSQNPFKAIRRATFEDNRLSFEARGVLAYILVKPDDWQMQVADLMRQGDMGRDKAYRIINELIETGYCERVEEREKGRIVGYSYLIHEEPLPEKPYTAQPLTAQPLTENKDYTNKENTTKEEYYTKEEKGLAAKPPPAPVAPKKKPASTAYVNPDTGTSTTAIMEAYKKLLPAGTILNHTQENAAAQALAKAGWTPTQVEECYKHMKKDPFWKSKHLALWSLAKQIGEYHARNSRNSGFTLTLEQQGIFLSAEPINPDDINF
jgi:DNA-binding MarR family transcriptional regulator